MFKYLIKDISHTALSDIIIAKIRAMCANSHPLNSPSPTPSCYAVSHTKVCATKESQGEAELSGPWACEVLPLEILEIVWNYLPANLIGTLSKSFYVEWKCHYLAANHKTHRDVANISKILRRQVLMNHTYTFSVCLEVRANSWLKMRPWKHNGNKFTSFLHYLKAMCQHANRQQMTMLCRDAINRHESKKIPEHKQRVRGNIMGKRNYWHSIA